MSDVKSTEVIHRTADVNNKTSSANHDKTAGSNNCLGEITRPV